MHIGICGIPGYYLRSFPSSNCAIKVYRIGSVGSSFANPTAKMPHTFGTTPASSMVAERRIRRIAREEVEEPLEELQGNKHNDLISKIKVGFRRLGDKVKAEVGNAINHGDEEIARGRVEYEKAISNINNTLIN